MAQIDIDKFVISLMRYSGNNKGIAITLARCLFSLGLKYVDTPTGGRLERVDQPTLLEKIMWESGEQKTVDKVEPKFKVGEWIINAQGTLRHILNVDKGGYQTDRGWLSHDTYEKTFHLWTIQDAKDGNVVADKSDGTIGIFQSIGHHPDGGSYNDPSYCFLHCHCDDEFFYADFENGNEIDSDDLVPATKEQRDLLFQKMKEAGYEWDDELKQLKKIEQKPAMIQWKGDNLKEVVDFTGKCENFDKWFKSFEEYEKYVHEHNDIFKIFNEDGSYMEVPVGAWIIKAPDGYNTASRFRFIPKSAEWSKEDEDTFKHLMDEIVCLGNERNSAKRLYYDKLIKFLDELKNRAQPREKWCNEDKRMFDRLIAYFEKRLVFTDKDYQEYAIWLRSLWILNGWKPTNEQIIALGLVLHDFPFEQDVLESLYEDLNKLK